MKSVVKINGIFQVGVVGAVFSNSADKLEGAEGVKAEGTEFSQYLRFFRCHSLTDSLGVAVLLGTVGIDEEYFLVFGRVLFGIGEKLFVKFGLVNARSIAYHIVLRKIFGESLQYVEKLDLILRCAFYGIKQFFCVSVVLGIVNYSSFHLFLLDFITVYKVYCISRKGASTQN